MLNERHPSDVVFLPDVNRLDSGYVFLTQEFDRHVVTCYRWDPAAGLALNGDVPQGFPAEGPNFLFLDRVDNVFYLGIASDHWGWGQLLAARVDFCLTALQPCIRGDSIEAHRARRILRVVTDVKHELIDAHQ